MNYAKLQPQAAQSMLGGNYTAVKLENLQPGDYTPFGIVASVSEYGLGYKVVYVNASGYIIGNEYYKLGASVLAWQAA